MNHFSIIPLTSELMSESKDWLPLDQVAAAALASFVSRALSVAADCNVSAFQFTGWSSSCILHFPQVLHDFHSFQTSSSVFLQTVG
jgi:hypothetical protein